MWREGDRDREMKKDREIHGERERESENKIGERDGGKAKKIKREGYEREREGEREGERERGREGCVRER